MNTRKFSRSDAYAEAQPSDIDRRIGEQHEDSIKGGRNEGKSEAGDNQRSQERNSKQLPGRQWDSGRGYGYRSVGSCLLELFWPLYLF